MQSRATGFTRMPMTSSGGPSSRARPQHLTPPRSRTPSSGSRMTSPPKRSPRQRSTRCCRRAETGSRVFGAGVVVAVIAVSALLYGYIATKGPGISGAGVTASSSKARRVREDVVMADLKPGVDGGSTGEGLPFALQRQVVFYRTTVVPGSIVVDRENRFLYLIDANNSARRYGIGIAQECLKGGSFFRIANKLEWPDWRTSGVNTRDADALLPTAGRPGSLLGSRALLLDKPGLLIHGTNTPKTIGHLVASGCIRLVNDDVEDLYRRVSVETRVVFAS